MVLGFNFKLRASTYNTCTGKILSFQLANKQEVKITSFDDALAKLETKIAELENYERELAKQKQIYEHKNTQLKFEWGVQKLENIAENINALAAQLESEIHNFKEVAVEVNRCYHLIQQLQNIDNKSKPNRWRPLNIWEIHFLSLPTVIRRGTRFIIVKKIINLFSIESDKNLQK